MLYICSSSNLKKVLMNVFATLKTVFFGSKFLSAPVPSDGTPRRDLVSALNGLMPLCRTMPGVHLAVDIREGRVALVLDWTPRTDGNALAGSYHYIVSDEDGVKEVDKSQILLAENGEGNLLESRDGFSGCLAALTEETEEESIQLENVREVMNPIHSKDIKKEAQPISLEDSRKEVGLKSSKDTEKEAAPISPEETVGKAKSRSLMQEVTTFLTSRYRFRFNVLTEETEVAGVENGISDDHLRYAKVDERWMNSLSLEAIEAGIDCWDRDIQRFVRSRRISEYHPFTAYFEQLPEWDGTDRVSALARRVSDNPVWVNGFHRWMLGLSAQWMQFHPDTNNANRANSINRANSVAPLLVSSRQGLGKSTFCRLLMPDALKAYYTESYDLGSPASAEARLAAYGLINLDEFDKLGVSKMPLLKNLMQASALNIRKAYKRSASALPRIASFIGTSNRFDLLTDPTGSRRFLCIEVKHNIDCIGIEHDQIFAQLKAELIAGRRNWFTKPEEEELQWHNEAFYRVSLVEEAVHSLFRTPLPAEKSFDLTAADIFDELQKTHPALMRGSNPMQFGSVLLRVGLKRRHTKYGNVYEVVRRKKEVSPERVER